MILAKDPYRYGSQLYGSCNQTASFVTWRDLRHRFRPPSIGQVLHLSILPLLIIDAPNFPFTFTFHAEPSVYDWTNREARRPLIG